MAGRLMTGTCQLAAAMDPLADIRPAARMPAVGPACLEWCRIFRLQSVSLGAQLRRGSGSSWLSQACRPVPTSKLTQSQRRIGISSIRRTQPQLCMRKVHTAHFCSAFFGGAPPREGHRAATCSMQEVTNISSASVISAVVLCAIAAAARWNIQEQQYS